MRIKFNVLAVYQWILKKTFLLFKRFYWEYSMGKIDKVKRWNNKMKIKFFSFVILPHNVKISLFYVHKNME